MAAACEDMKDGCCVIGRSFLATMALDDGLASVLAY